MFSSSFDPSSRKAQASALAVAAAAAGLLATFSAPASANEIGIQFAGAASSTSSAVGTPLPSTQAAGVVSQTNWNTEGAGSNQTGVSGLVDSSGTLVPNLLVAWTSAYGADISGGGGHGSLDTGLNDLYSAHLESPYGVGGSGSYPVGNNRVQAYLSGIPYASYDIYVYTGNRGGNPGEVLQSSSATWDTSTGSGTITYSTAKTITFNDLAASTYTLGDNYVEFTGLTGSTQYLVAALQGNPGNTTGGANLSGLNNGFAGIQIVESSAIPEPATLGLMAVAGAGILLLKRRHPKQA